MSQPSTSTSFFFSGRLCFLSIFTSLSYSPPSPFRLAPESRAELMFRRLNDAAWIRNFFRAVVCSLCGVQFIDSHSLLAVAGFFSVDFSSKPLIALFQQIGKWWDKQMIFRGICFFIFRLSCSCDGEIGERWEFEDAKERKNFRSRFLNMWKVWLDHIKWKVLTIPLKVCMCICTHFKILTPFHRRQTV